MGHPPSNMNPTSPLGCPLDIENLKPLHPTPDVKASKFICLCTQTWPKYPLDNRSKRLTNGQFRPQHFIGSFHLQPADGEIGEGAAYGLAFFDLSSNPPLSVSCLPSHTPLPQTGQSELEEPSTNLDPANEPLLFRPQHSAAPPAPRTFFSSSAVGCSNHLPLILSPTPSLLHLTPSPDPIHPSPPIPTQLPFSRCERLPEWIDRLKYVSLSH